ncbi:MAG: hypothetical protein AAF292_16390 [Pseudomonadota bacterium]
MNKTPFQFLLEEICVRYGFCEFTRAFDGQVPASGLITGHQFAEWIYLAEGMDPSTSLEFQREWRAKFTALFEKYLGNDPVDVVVLK